MSARNRAALLRRLLLMAMFTASCVAGLALATAPPGQAASARAQSPTIPSDSSNTLDEMLGRTSVLPPRLRPSPQVARLTPGLVRTVEDVPGTPPSAAHTAERTLTATAGETPRVLDRTDQAPTHLIGLSHPEPAVRLTNRGHPRPAAHPTDPVHTPTSQPANPAHAQPPFPLTDSKHAPAAHLAALAHAPASHLREPAHAPTAHLADSAHGHASYLTDSAHAPTPHLTTPAHAPTPHLTDSAHAPTAHRLCPGDAPSAHLTEPTHAPTPYLTTPAHAGSGTRFVVRAHGQPVAHLVAARRWVCGHHLVRHLAVRPGTPTPRRHRAPAASNDHRTPWPYAPTTPASVTAGSAASSSNAAGPASLLPRAGVAQRLAMGFPSAPMPAATEPRSIAHAPGHTPD